MLGHMAFREVAVTAIREVLRAWRAGAVEAGQARDGGVAPLASIIGVPFLFAAYGVLRWRLRQNARANVSLA